MTFERIPSRKLTESEKQEMRDRQNNIITSILQKVASHNIRSHHYDRIKAILEELNQDLERSFEYEWVVPVCSIKN